MMASTKSRSLSSRSKTTKKKVKTKLSTPSLLSEDNEPDIFKCAWTGSVKKAQRVAQHDPSELCQRDTTFLGEGNTPLHYASYRGMVKFVEFLLQYPQVQENIDCRNDEGCTPLFSACQQNQYQTVLALLEKGANPLKQASSKLTPADVASDAGIVGLFVDPQFYRKISMEWKGDDSTAGRDQRKIGLYAQLHPPAPPCPPSLTIQGRTACISWKNSSTTSDSGKDMQQLSNKAVTVQLLRLIEDNEYYCHDPPPPQQQASRFRTTYNWPWFRSTEEGVYVRTSCYRRRNTDPVNAAVVKAFIAYSHEFTKVRDDRLSALTI
eukprot:gb/GECG01003651.1/.p1 GENE.gb/GECG01003651.1/~~gb/GECG01003651.1/.p1  ORF type:complete len:322 (+),score=34.63 gb/GECG01003651.1/:1-966(+)